MATLWIIALYFKATLYFYASVLGMAQILNLKDYRPLTITVRHDCCCSFSRDLSKRHLPTKLGQYNGLFLIHYQSDYFYLFC